MKSVHVAVGVIVDPQQRILLALRPDDLHQGGLWEFPGGKVEAGESVPEALARELAEELGIAVSACSALLAIDHDYGDKRVYLDVYLVSGFSGEAAGREGQALRWACVTELADFEFPAANQAIIDALQARWNTLGYLVL